MNIYELLNIYIKTAQTITNTDPIYDALSKSNLGPGTVQNNPAMIKVVTDMARQGIPSGEKFGIGLQIGPDQIPVFSINPENKTVLNSLKKHIAPLIKKAIAKIPLENTWFSRTWIPDLFWE